MKQGLFVTFEGIEGCGKSTQVQLLAEWLQARSIPHCLTREPGGTEVGKSIRQILLSQQTRELDPHAELLLYLADRLQHVAQVIRPELNAGRMVVCDRFHDSTVAYQGYARGLSKQLIDTVWQNSGAAITPSLTFLIDVSPEVGISRSLQKLKEQQLDESRFENEALEFHARVREGFMDLARLEPARFVILNGMDTPEQIHQKIVVILENHQGQNQQ